MPKAVERAEARIQPHFAPATLHGGGAGWRDIPAHGAEKQAGLRLKRQIPPLCGESCRSPGEARRGRKTPRKALAHRRTHPFAGRGRASKTGKMVYIKPGLCNNDYKIRAFCHPNLRDCKKILLEKGRRQKFQQIAQHNI